MLKHAEKGGFWGLEVAGQKYGVDRACIIEIIKDMKFDRCFLTTTARNRVVSKVVERIRIMQRLAGHTPSPRILKK